MSRDAEEWLCDSNEALSLRLRRAPEDEAALQGTDAAKIETFHPDFTYPIFGDQEKIFGYKNLDLQLHFASGSLKQYLSITYDEKLESEDTPADDIEGTLFNFIPPDYTKSSVAFESTLEDDGEDFRPLGDKIASFSRAAASKKGKGKANGGDAPASREETVDYEVYHATWNTPGFRAYHRRMQIFILLFIEGGSYVQEDEDAWEFFTMYEKRKRAGSDQYTYHFVGYTSVYPFWCYPDLVRLRLSQFVILPPYQHQGIGSNLYQALFQHMLARPGVAELTVEDPAEAFEDLRDRNDLRFLVKEGVPEDPKFLEGVGAENRGGRVKWENELRKKYKIAQRQFDRLLEMLLLRQLDRRDPEKVKNYRLQVKARLYRFNYEIMSQMDAAERKEALAKTYDGVVEDYDRILKMTFH